MLSKTVKRRIYGFILGGTLLLMGLVHVSGANYADPGSKDDPLVTMSYVEKRYEQLKYYIDQKIQGQGGEGSSGQTGDGATFVVLQLTKEQRLIGEEGTEIILRSGDSTALGNINGDGLANVTKGKDLKTGEKIELNNLLIIPKGDGRGIVAKSNIHVMVKGRYSIQ